MQQPGLAGAFIGLAGEGVVVVAGGCSRWRALRNLGDRDIWSDAVFVLRCDDRGRWRWVVDVRNRLPRPLAFGTAVAVEDGLLCLGGRDRDRCHDGAFLLAWDEETESIKIRTQPSLPRPLAHMAAAAMGNVVYVVGGQTEVGVSRATHTFWMLDLGAGGDSERRRQWDVLPPWPGPPRIDAVLGAQVRAQSGPLLILCSGRNVQPALPTTMLSDCFAYTPPAGDLAGGWSRRAYVGTPEAEPVPVMGGSAVSVGDRFVAVIGGDSGEAMRRSEQLSRRVAAIRRTLVGESDPQRKRQLELDLREQSEALRRMALSHAGYSRTIWLYDCSRDRWDVGGRLPMDHPPISSPAVRWRDDWLILTGVIRPDTTTPEAWLGRPSAQP